MDSDYELLQRWGAGSKEAGNALFQRHFSAVYRFFCNKTGDGVEDLVQQTFLACVEGRERFRRDATFRTYLFQTARFVLYRHYRTLRRDQNLDFTNVSVDAMVTSPTLHLARQEQERILLACLRRLPLELQVAVELSYWEELTDAQIAEVQEVPRGTVASRLRRARAELKRLLAREALELGALQTADNLEVWLQDVREQLV